MTDELSPDPETVSKQENANGEYCKHLRERLAESRAQLDRGEYLEFDEEGMRMLFEELIAKSTRDCQ